MPGGHGSAADRNRRPAVVPRTGDRHHGGGRRLHRQPRLQPDHGAVLPGQDVTIIPGVNNPSLVEQAMEMGLRHLKFFPAEQSGGIAMLKALGAVYPVRFMPTGGVTPANLKEYLGLNAVIACGGTWMVPAKLIDEGRWEELAALVREAVAAL
ncbi:hypothetical protein [Aeromonas caviae]|uniref:hypothetical protein n=1 Tax=Aeromonas caviae TaxID=648 RepID=UPI001CC49409|nr:hypothetical protein [Aeromonas caviae]